MRRSLVALLLAAVACSQRPAGRCAQDLDCPAGQACSDGACVSPGDTTAPGIAWRTPIPDATGVAPEAVVRVTFTEEVDPATVGTATFLLRGPGAVAVDGAVALAGATATFTPSPPLAYSTTYTATIAAGVKDLAGNATASADTWSFTVVAAPNVAPDATPIATVAVVEDLDASVSLTGTDAEDLEVALEVEVVTTPRHGALTPESGAAPLLVTYTPDPDWHGPDGFSFRVVDSAGAPSAPVSVALDVASTNDLPAAAPLEVTATEDVARSILLTGTDVESATSTLSVEVVSPAAHGTVTPALGAAPLTVSYQPDPEYSGTDAFAYRVTDPDAGASGPALVSIAIAPVNDPPFAASTSTGTSVGTPVAVTLAGSDPDDAVSVLSAVVVAGPQHGSVSPASGPAPLAVTYTPDPGWSGVDGFSFRVDDPHGASSAPAVFTITVQAVSHAPVAAPDAGTVCAGGAALVAVLANDSDGDGDPLALTSVGAAAHGSVAIAGSAVSYASDPAYAGTDAFEYTISDGTGRSATGTVSMTVSGPAISSLFPASGTTGIPLQISGGCFGASEGTVTIGGRAAAVTTWTSRYVVATVPTDYEPGSYAVAVAPQSGPAAFATYGIVPWIGTVDPWYAASGAAQSIVGDAFVTAPGTVLVGGVAARVDGWTNTVVQSRAGLPPTTWTLTAQTSTGLATNAVPVTSAGPNTWWTHRAPEGRLGHTAVWTGTEMIVWGGSDQGPVGPGGLAFSSGGRYDPRFDTWVPTAAVNRSRRNHSVVWTGTEMIVWGGNFSGVTQTGSRYDPARDAWSDVTTTGAPSARQDHSAVWTGTRMLVWGGFDATTSTYLATGGTYDPSANHWDAAGISTVNAPSPRSGHVAVWTGTEMIVWGGYDGGYRGTGARYDPASDRWTPMATSGAPSARSSASAVWTGTELIVWGGSNGAGNFASGARYDPAADAWTPLPLAGAPIARNRHTAIWTGRDMIVWGGIGTVSGAATRFATGGRYDPVTDAWSPTSVVGAPLVRERHTAVWTGAEMIVWGGYGGLDTGGRYHPSTDTWTPTRAGAAGEPQHRRGHASACVGGDLVVWGGSALGAGDVATGARYRAAIDSWVALATSGAPSAREGHSAVDTGAHVIVWGGKYVSPSGTTTYLADGARWDPAADEWTAISTSGAPSPRSGHTAVWAAGKMVVWGGRDASAVLQTGGAYDPATDTWEALPTGAAPAARQLHAVVSTGPEMIVWGGEDLTGSTTFSDGVRYDVAGRTWTALPSSGLAARSGHTAVWTGSRMIIWGGHSTTGITFADGAAFSPLDGTWSSIASAGGGLYDHAAAWDGAGMLVWAGLRSGIYRQTGYRYDPATDAWTQFTTAGAPHGREFPSACWTGTSLVVWGGSYNGWGVGGLGRYAP